MTASDADVESLALLAEDIGPDLVQLNTVVRPPAESVARAVPRRELERLAGLFAGPVEIIAEKGPVPVADEQRGGHAGEIRELVVRRPCTVEQIAAGLGIGVLDALPRVDALVAAGAVERVFHDGDVYVAPAQVGAVGKEQDESGNQRTR